jgi:hypothetical protein
VPGGDVSEDSGEDRAERCPVCGVIGELVTAEGDVLVFACPLSGRHDDWSIPIRGEAT